jgi:predicted alpha/beta hydrolase family esterase
MKDNLQAVFVHGTYGNPGENWFPWLKTELEKLGYKVVAPSFPTPQDQEPEKWLSILDRAVTTFDDHLIMAGHSLGDALILRKLEQLQQPIRAAFLVSGFLGELGNSQFDPVNAPFFRIPFNWDKIKRNCHSFFVYNGDNDPYVPLEKGRELARHLDTQLHIVKGGGHINESAGFTRFDRLLQDIKTVSH